VQAPAGVDTAELEGRLAALDGTSLTAHAVLDTFLGIAGHLPSGATGVTVRLERPGDDTGAVLTMELAAGHVEGMEWQTGALVTAGGRPLWSSMGASSEDSGLDPESWKDGERALDKAMRAPPDREVYARFLLLREQ